MTLTVSTQFWSHWTVINHFHTLSLNQLELQEVKQMLTRRYKSNVASHLYFPLSKSEWFFTAAKFKTRPPHAWMSFRLWALPPCPGMESTSEKTCKQSTIIICTLNRDMINLILACLEMPENVSLLESNQLALCIYITSGVKRSGSKRVWCNLQSWSGYSEGMLCKTLQPGDYCDLLTIAPSLFLSCISGWPLCIL